ncbi:MAG: hypothetical protein HYW85_05960, partial [Deltaproteobacteria bacterium]|nr:hypothetical protein [Deltaproteobacteria bacterium]
MRYKSLLAIFILIGGGLFSLGPLQAEGDLLPEETNIFRYLPTSPPADRILEILDQLNQFIQSSGSGPSGIRAQALEFKHALILHIRAAISAWHQEEKIPPIITRDLKSTLSRLADFSDFQAFVQSHFYEGTSTLTLMALLKFGPEEYVRLLHTPIDVKQLEGPLGELKKEGLIPHDFIPTHENGGPFGPGSRLVYIPEDQEGPWDLLPNGRRLWWNCYLHGKNSQGVYLGALRFYFNIVTGEIFRSSYSPQGNWAWFSPLSTVALFQDLPAATGVSAFAFNDLKIYRSLQESGYVPAGYVRDPQEPLLERDLQDPLAPTQNPFGSRRGDAAEYWVKVMEKGFIGTHPVEVHYFKNRWSGEVSRVEFYPDRIQRTGGEYRHKIILTVHEKGTQRRFRRDHVIPQVIEQPQMALAMIEGR